MAAECVNGDTVAIGGEGKSVVLPHHALDEPFTRSTDPLPLQSSAGSTWASAPRETERHEWSLVRVCVCLP